MDDRNDEEILEALADRANDLVAEVAKLRRKATRTEQPWVVTALQEAETALSNAEDRLRFLL